MNNLPEINLGKIAIEKLCVNLSKVGSKLEISVIIQAPAINGDGSVYINTTSLVPIDTINDREALALSVRDTVMKAFMHEIEEWLHIDGVKILDPHKITK